MGAMGRYIEALSVEGRDRLIVGAGWTAQVLDDGRGNRCLIGHGHDYHRDHRGNAFSGLVLLAGGDRTPEWWRLHAVGKAFDRAALRWKDDRVVRAIKLRAAKLNGCSPEAIAHLLEQRQEIPA